MRNTPNIGLPIYGSGDTPDWQDTNDGFEKLDNIVGGAAGVQLDFANPLHVFTQSNNTYTATQTCWLFGSFIAIDNQYGYVTVDGTRVAGIYDANIGYPAAFIPPIRIEAGSVIEVTNLGPDTYPARQCLAVYPGEIVSDTFVWNEAIVELDYANPLYTFTAGGSYTCEKRCWMIGTCMNTAVSVNGNRITDGSSGYYSNIPLTPLSKGDVINVTTGGSGINILVLDGTIKGSAPGNSGVDLLELLDFDNAVVLTTSAYTAPKNGAIIGSNLLSGSGSNVTLTADGLPIMMAPANTAPQRDNAAVYGIQKGTVLQLSGAVEPLQCSIRFFPYKYESIAPEITVYNEAEVELDYANPLYVFSASDTSYTATKDCWLVGCIGGGNLPELKINNTTIMKAYYSASTFLTQIPVYYKLTSGDVVTLTGYSASVTYLSVFEGTVSGSVGNLTGAWIPNYSDHIASLTYNGGTYTATQDCIVEFGMLTNQTGTVATIQVNGNKIGRACSYSNGIVPVNKQIKLKKGDIFTWSNADANSFLGEVYGLM